MVADYTAAAKNGGDAAKGKLVFESEKSNCKKCHSVGKKEVKAGPDLMVIGDLLLRHLYQVYDFENQTISLGLDKHSQDKMLMYE